MVKDILEVVFKNTGKSLMFILVFMCVPMGLIIANDKLTESGEEKCLSHIQDLTKRQILLEKELDRYKDKQEILVAELEVVKEEDRMTKKQLEFCTINCNRGK